MGYITLQYDNGNYSYKLSVCIIYSVIFLLKPLAILTLLVEVVHSV